MARNPGSAFVQHVVQAVIIEHDDVIKWKHFPRDWPFVQGIHWSPVNSPNKGQWRGAFMFSLICAWINGWLNNGDAGDLRRHQVHYDVIVMKQADFASPVVTSCHRGMPFTKCQWCGKRFHAVTPSSPNTHPLHICRKWYPLWTKRRWLSLAV